ncbi:transmembrane protein 116 isoform X1 [Mastacembelus armatus]|uniref:transmembrane protein 116 isoform X1 n=1 Tax=Mastacembelus armatus TaxID=205130 RepID=UPI000E46423E|nr:transmembrane protein 116 isoform X1 [Mastacembelus armatus]
MGAVHTLPEGFPNSTETNTTRALDWTQVYEAVRWIQLLMALLSVLGSGSIIVCVMLQRLCRTPELQPLLLLSVSDMLLALCWLIGAVLFSKHCSSLNTHCYNLHTVEQILYMASFFYTLNYMWDLYRGVREKFYSCLDGFPVQFSNRVSTAGKITALLSGLIPVLLMTPVFVQGNISQCQVNFSEPYRCLLMHTGALYLTPESQQPIRACSLLHTYSIAIFLATFIFTLLSTTAGRDVRRLSWQPAAGLLPCVGPTDGPVPSGLRPVLGPSCGSGVAAGGEAVSVSGRGRGHPLHIPGLHLGLSGFPQLSGVRLDSCTSASSRQDLFFSGRGHSDASAAITEEEEELRSSAQHQLKDWRTDRLSCCYFRHLQHKAREESLNFHFH